jgi:mycothiol synthase
MALGSNIIRETGRGDEPPAERAGVGPGARPAITCRPASRGELTAALSLVLGAAGQPADDVHVTDFLHFARNRGIRTADAWLAELGGRLAWALLPLVSPGRTMLLLGPGGAPAGGAERQAAGELIDAVCASFAGRDVQLAQVLLDPADAASHGLYGGRAFARVAELIYLQAAPRRKAAAPALPAGFQWLGYGPQTHALFAQTIGQTYHQSLDCPSLNGLRDIEDVLAGHKASGDFDPRLWALLCEGDAPRGALLLSHMRYADTVELVYLGLVDAGRRRGLADLMMRQALAATAAIGAARLSLAVDSGNVPALKLYYRHGMHRVGAKLAMMRRLDGSAGATTS